jgi:alpha-tubulin suppressor-like RCC1 family protein
VADGYGYRSSNGSAVRLVRGELPLGTATSFTPSADFFHNGDGTVTHLKTGLMWKRCAEGQVWSGTTCSSSASTYAWGAAVALTSDSAGYGDWRIPTENELLTIVDYKAHSPAINTAIFPSAASSNFWSGSRLANSSSDAWYVNFDDGAANSSYGRSANGAVRLVRRGQFFGPWGFKSQTGVAANTSVASDALTVYGDGGVITIEGGEYAINSGPYTAAPGTVKANDSVRVRVTATSGVTTVALLSIGTVSGPFQVTAAPIPAANPTAPTAKLAAGASHSAGIKSDGSLLVWGDNDSGQLGLGSTGGARTAPQAAPHGSSYQSLALGASHSVALRIDGSLWAWGGNASGQLGDGSATTRSSPVQIGSDYITAAAGNAHTLGVKSDKSLWAWGNNRGGQLGNGADNSAASPVQIGNGFFAIAAGTSHSAGIKSDGGLWAWGSNTFGQIGDGTGYDRYAPTLVGKGYAAVAAGAFHTIALSTDGGLWSWGQNDVGQLGDGTATMRATPRQIGTGFGAVAAGTSHSIALRQDGTVWAWGSNSSGQLGLGTSTQSRIPQQLPGVAGVTAIAAGGNMSLALKGDGTVLAWGSNHAGQLGDGTFGQRTSPVLVVKSGSDGFLNLAEQTIKAVPAAQNVPFFVTGTGSITTSSTSVATTTKFNPVDAGKTGAVYITAMVPSGSLGTTPAAQGASPSRASMARNSSVTAAAAAALAYTLVQLTPTGWKTVVNSQLIPFASGVLGDLLAAQTLLNNTATADLQGAQFCVGYGQSAQDMVTNGNIRVVATIPGATSPTSCVVGGTLTVSINVTSGWNLLGNPVKQSIAVANTFGDASKVTSVWKWDAAAANWQFYAPGLSAADLQAYAASQGYTVLAEINGGNGYWVNSKTQANLGSVTGEAINLRESSLASGWNLVSTASLVTPQYFNLTLSTTPPTLGQVPINLTSLWAWDSVQSNWFFYAPSMEAQGGSALADYITAQRYQDFAAGSKTLGNGAGFWVRRP